jgi:hypothetical protein
MWLVPDFQFPESLQELSGAAGSRGLLPSTPSSEHDSRDAFAESPANATRQSGVMVNYQFAIVSRAIAGATSLRENELT